MEWKNLVLSHSICIAQNTLTMSNIRNNLEEKESQNVDHLVLHNIAQFSDCSPFYISKFSQYEKGKTQVLDLQTYMRDGLSLQ